MRLDDAGAQLSSEPYRSDNDFLTTKHNVLLSILQHTTVVRWLVWEDLIRFGNYCPFAALQYLRFRRSALEHNML